MDIKQYIEEVTLKEIQTVVFNSYAEFSNGMVRNVDRTPVISVTFGKKFAKLISNSHGSSSAFAFICLEDNGKFKKGDVLKAASWNAPAKNFARASIYDQESLKKNICWTGVVY